MTGATGIPAGKLPPMDVLVARLADGYLSPAPSPRVLCLNRPVGMAPGTGESDMRPGQEKSGLCVRHRRVRCRQEAADRVAGPAVAGIGSGSELPCVRIGVAIGATVFLRNAEIQRTCPAVGRQGRMTTFTFHLEVFSLQSEHGRAMVELRGGESGFRVAGFTHAAARPASELPRCTSA